MTATAGSRPTAAYSATLEVELAHQPGTLGRLCTAIGDVGGNIQSLDGFTITQGTLRQHIVVDASSEQHIVQICDAVNGLEGITVISSMDRTFELHDGGKLETVTRIPLRNADDLSMAYTPGVARVCRAIVDAPERGPRPDDQGQHGGDRHRRHGGAGPRRHRSGRGHAGHGGQGTALQGIRRRGCLPDLPRCRRARRDRGTVIRLAPTFGGINLEDIAAPGAFEVEEALRAALDIPVFHDDQHGTAVVALAALRNSARIVGKELANLRCVILGAGAAGVATAKILLGAGIGDVIACDRKGTIHPGRSELNHAKEWLAANTNAERVAGTVSDAMAGADVFFGLSGPGLITRDDVGSMAERPIVFAMANPDPEILPDAIGDIAAVVATGRSDYPNQINNVLAFPGIFRGAFDAGATDITENMKIAAAEAIAAGVSSDDLAPDLVIPTAFDRSVVPAVATAVAAAARTDQVTR